LWDKGEPEATSLLVSSSIALPYKPQNVMKLREMGIGPGGREIFSMKKQKIIRLSLRNSSPTLL
jgi:hypothetical protein